MTGTKKWQESINLVVVVVVTSLGVVLVTALRNDMALIEFH